MKEVDLPAGFSEEICEIFGSFMLAKYGQGLQPFKNKLTWVYWQISESLDVPGLPEKFLLGIFHCFMIY